MPKYEVVPQEVIDQLAPALSSSPNLGAVLAEQLCRSENGGTLLQKLQAGQKLTALERTQLPPLKDGHNWDDIGANIKLDLGS